MDAFNFVYDDVFLIIFAFIIYGLIFDLYSKT